MAAWHAAKMMVPAKQGLIVNVSSAGGLRYLFNVAYGVGKAAVSTPSLHLPPSSPLLYTTCLCYYIVHWKLFQWFLPVSATLLRHYPIFAELSTGSMINKLRCSQPSYRNILISPRRTEWLQTWLWNYANRTWRVSLCGQEPWRLRLWRTWFSAKQIKEERYSSIINAMFHRG